MNLPVRSINSLDITGKIFALFIYMTSRFVLPRICPNILNFSEDCFFNAIQLVFDKDYYNFMIRKY